MTPIENRNGFRGLYDLEVSSGFHNILDPLWITNMRLLFTSQCCSTSFLLNSETHTNVSARLISFCTYCRYFCFLAGDFFWSYKKFRSCIDSTTFILSSSMGM